MSKCILIVDDELDFTELLQYRLHDRDYKLVFAQNATDAINQTWQHTPDLILLDLLLPDLDGLTVCEILQRNESTRNIPIIMISAVASPVTQASAGIAGAHEFFPKPVDFDRLRHRLDTLLAPPRV